MTTYLDVLFAPADILPVRYRRKSVPAPEQAPVSTPPFPAPAPSTRPVTNAANYKLWSDFTSRLLELFRPFPDAVNPLNLLLGEFESRFREPPGEIPENRTGKQGMT